MAVVSGLLEIHVPEVLHHAPGQDEQGGEHDGGQDNGRYRHEISCPVRFEAPGCQCVDDGFLFFHGYTPLHTLVCMSIKILDHGIQFSDSMV